MKYDICENHTTVHRLLIQTLPWSPCLDTGYIMRLICAFLYLGLELLTNPERAKGHFLHLFRFEGPLNGKWEDAGQCDILRVHGEFSFRSNGSTFHIPSPRMMSRPRYPDIEAWDVHVHDGCAVSLSRFFWRHVALGERSNAKTVLSYWGYPIISLGIEKSYHSKTVPENH